MILFNLRKKNRRIAKFKKSLNKFSKQINNLQTERDSKIFFIVDDFWTNSTISIPNASKIFNNKFNKSIMHIDDAERFTNIITECFDEEIDLDIIVFSTGGTVRVSDYVISTLMQYPNNIRMHVPHYAHSAASMIVLSGKEIYLNASSHLSPTDPHVTYKMGSNKLTYSHSLLELQKTKATKKISDDTFTAIQDAIRFHEDNIVNLKLMLKPKGMDDDNLDKLLDLFGSGKYPHHKPYHTNILNEFGLGIQNPVDDKINDLFNKFMKIRSDFK
jgi:ClpP class serine protease